VQRLNTLSLDRSSVEVVVEDIKAMAKVFISASFIHVK
jgi:hypothetical protein